MTLDSNQLFLAVADRKSISRASEELHISQSTISTSLGKLESALGVRLFDRTKYPIELTYAGFRYYHYAMQLQTAANRLNRNLKEQKSNGHSRLRVGMSAWKSSYFIKYIYPLLVKAIPNIELDIRKGDVNELEQMILSDEIDICLVNASRFNEKIIYDILTSERILLVGPAAHPIVSANPTSIKTPSNMDIRKLEEERFFLNRPRQEMHRNIINLFYKYQFYPRFVTYTSLSLTQLQLATTGMGFCFVPELGWEYYSNREKVACYTVDEPALSWPLSVAYLNGHPMSDAEEAFIEIVRDLIGS